MRLLISGTTRSLQRAIQRAPESFGRLLTPAGGSGVGWAAGAGLPFAADNGCYRGLDVPGFRSLLRRVSGHANLLWTVCPDVVANAPATLALFDEWYPELQAAAVPVAFVAQDGQEDLPLPWERISALFIGGSTRWKLSEAAADLGTEAKRRGLLLHMGRVNSRRRLEAALRIGCDSVDGTGMSKWGDRHLLKFARWLRQIEAQPALF